jgi:hypothetical protein
MPDTRSLSEPAKKLPFAHPTADSLMMLMGFSIITGALRFALWSANWITLWYLYGWATVQHDHLRIVRIKPELVVSNGDVLKGIGAYHYFVGVAIWLPVAFGLYLPIFYKLVPPRIQALTTQRRRQSESWNSWPVLLVLPLAFLVTAGLDMRPAMLLAAGTAGGTLLWLRKLEAE